jgi:hypothetical protein
MPCRYGTAPDHRVSVELVEADIEIGFCLVDLAESCPADATRLVANAEEVYEDLLARLTRLEPLERSNFQPLVTELRRAIDLALPPGRSSY